VFQEFVEVVATDTGEDRFAGEIDSVIHITIEDTNLMV
jgi:hypothetical protein